MAASWRRYVPLLPHPDKPKTVAVVRIAGTIGGGGRLRAGLRLAQIEPVLKRAFGMRSAAAVALEINSPGGTPVQAGLIYNRIRQLAAEKQRKVYAFAEDVAASGGYLIALAADEIFVHDASIVGSIGVISGGFGFDQAIAKLGIDRRLYATGDRKAMLDPFSPEKPEDVARLRELQTEIQNYFKALVEDRRGARLQAGGGDLFNGDVWVGRQAIDVGLADGVGDIASVLRAKFGDDVRLRRVAPAKRMLWGGVPSFAERADLAGNAIAGFEEHAAWRRFGL
ncbi:MAG: S49 family peptidase [Sphingomonadales bacterium]